MRYRETQPTEFLARFIECFWILESNGSVGPIQTERILPDGCVELIINFGAPFRESKPSGEGEVQPARFLVGQMTRPMLIAATGTVDLIGIRFHPGGTFPFFRVPMHEINNQVVELAALSSHLERDLIPIVESVPSLKLKIIALEKLLVERVRDCKHDSWLVGMAAKIVKRAGQVSIDALAESAGVSTRQLERRFLHEVGVGPKLFCRILRFQEIFRAIDRDNPQWAAVAADCGYYDQAHLIRDFRQFAHQTPSILFAHSSQLTEAFTRKHRMSDFSNTRAPDLS
jgi:AraC-like DNA-binding protein